ncbi:MAG: T9SS type A sorting domain-containing protein [Chitinophagales bacterium]|nr:T9SS type A sorting domain-containing protein [Chitinophagales bacterium]
MKKIYSILSLMIIAAFASAQVTVTFKVDITNYLDTTTLNAAGMRVGGNFTTNGATILDWSPDDAASAMTEEADDVWSISTTFPAASIGDTLQFKFVNGTWGTNEGTGPTTSIVSGSCGIADAGGNINRILVIPAEDAAYEWCYDECTRCDGSDPLLGIFEINTVFTTILTYPNPASDITTLNFTISQPSAVTFELYNITGELVKSTQSNFNYSGPAVYDLNVSDLNTGIYMVVVIENNNRMISTLSVN